MLQLKTDLLDSIFGQERATALLEQVASSLRDRDLLHNSLLQRKSKLQVSISRFTLEPGHGALWPTLPLWLTISGSPVIDRTGLSCGPSSWLHSHLSATGHCWSCSLHQSNYTVFHGPDAQR